MSDNGVIVGIDLGTTLSEVSALVGDRPRVLGPGAKMLPSCVGLSPQGQLLIGEPARNQLLVYPELTVRSVKRHMGTNDRFELGDKSFSPPEISALILRELVQWAEQELQTKVTRAVITVPAYFSDAQRQATREAGELAGLEVVRILNEPTAASLAYGFEDQTRRTALVYDLGGGTFDVSLVSIEGDVTEVLASHGNNHLGGDDFDQLILDKLLKEFETRHHVDLKDRNPVSYSRLRWAAEEAKKKLSSEQYVRIREEALATGPGGAPLHLDLELSREEYEAMIRPLLDSTMESVFQALGDAGKRAEDIDVVLLVGGSTRTPLVRQLLEEHVGAPVRQDIHPDLCVALGAGLLASRLAGHDVHRVLVDVSPYSFGPSYLGPRDGEMYPYCYRPIIKRNTPLPVTRTERYFTAAPYQTAVEVSIFQGDDPDALKDILVGNFLVEGLTPVPEENEVLCRMSLDIDGILRVEAIEKRTGLSKHILIKDAIKPKSEAELAHARARLRHLYSERAHATEARWEETVEAAPEAAAETAVPSAPGGPPEAELMAQMAEAQRLIDRSRELLPAVHDEDKEEIVDLHEKIQEAIDAANQEALAAAVEALRELLFFIEGK
ncbi:MAG: heat-shock protein Hsp70 [Planctomycetes bacterium]|nr:heat-shock protein Hsp70 [Planctomycetota bacterium]